MRWIHRGARAAAVGVLALLVPAGSALAQDGPGYGGTADELSVEWVQQEEAMLAMGASDRIELTGSPLLLDVFGLGFRGKSEVLVTVGSSNEVATRVDTTGTLELSVGAAELTEGPQPGTSVVVQGRAPSGAARTLVGAVPPLPSGTGPADVVPWAVAAVLAGFGVLRWRGRQRADRD